MGTRGVWGYYKSGVHKVAYNHFDSYPEGLGQNVLDFCKNNNCSKLDDYFNGIELVGDKPPSEDQKKKCQEYNSVDLYVSKKSLDDWYCLLRKTHNNPELASNVGLMESSYDFLADSLFCEWAYIINLDDYILEVYKGFNKNIPIGRYKNMKPLDDNQGYMPVTLIGKFSLAELPSNLDSLFDEDNE